MRCTQKRVGVSLADGQTDAVDADKAFIQDILYQGTVLHFKPHLMVIFGGQDFRDSAVVIICPDIR